MGKLMTVSARLKIGSAYVLRDENVRTLWELLEAKIGKVKADALCADDIEREFTSADDLVGYENFPAKKIQELEFSARSADRESASRLRFGQRYSPYIEFTAEGEEAVVSSVKSHVANLCEAIKPWYSGITKIEFLYVGIAVFGLALLILNAMSGDAPVKPMSFKFAIVAIVAVAAVFALLGVLVWGLNALRRKFFPIGTFAIGAEKQRHQFNDNVRWVVFVGFFVALAAALVFAVIWR
jgi:hypothetical protein